ncbi:MAG: hypothetical protein HC900_00975 [Methylacidiphilales bacterium]|nr:hypothetical protein [Candidatus Methylacidiphilales bacterium]
MTTTTEGKRVSESVEFLFGRLESTAEWRTQKATEYPDDTRNERAADVAKSLYERFKGGEISADLCKQFEELNTKVYGGDDGDLGFKIEEQLSEYFRNIGFHLTPGSPDELLGDAIEIIEGEIESDADKSDD